MFIYTDGACKGNPGPGGWGVVMYLDEACTQEHKVMYGGESATTNNRMEMMAMIKALEYVTENDLTNVVIYTDSTYVMKGITEWMSGWKRRGWRKADGQPVLNKDLWIMVSKLYRQTIHVKKVKGHSGDIGNDRADELANMGIN